MRSPSAASTNFRHSSTELSFHFFFGVHCRAQCPHLTSGRRDAVRPHLALSLATGFGDRFGSSQGVTRSQIDASSRSSSPFKKCARVSPDPSIRASLGRRECRHRSPDARDSPGGRRPNRERKFRSHRARDRTNTRRARSPCRRATRVPPPGGSSNPKISLMPRTVLLQIRPFKHRPAPGWRGCLFVRLRSRRRRLGGVRVSGHGRIRLQVESPSG